MNEMKNIKSYCFLYKVISFFNVCEDFQIASMFVFVYYFYGSIYVFDPYSTSTSYLKYRILCILQWEKVEQNQVQVIVGVALWHNSGFSCGPLYKWIAHPCVTGSPLSKVSLMIPQPYSSEPRALTPEQSQTFEAGQKRSKKFWNENKVAAKVAWQWKIWKKKTQLNFNSNW